jgi:hypothetical protein
VGGLHVVKFNQGDLYVFTGSVFIVQGYLSLTLLVSHQVFDLPATYLLVPCNGKRVKPRIIHILKLSIRSEQTWPSLSAQ